MPHFNNRLVPFLVFAFGCLPLALSRTAEAATNEAASLLPDSVVVFAEISDPPQLVQTLLNHPGKERVKALPGYKNPMTDKQRRDLKVGLAILEAELQMDWPAAFKSLTRGGISLAIDAPTQGAALLIRSAGDAELEKIMQSFLKLARADATNKGRPDPVKSVDYRGITAYQAGEARFATFDSWLVVTNKPQLGKAILDIHLGDDKPTLAAKENFQLASGQRDAALTLWSYLDLEMVRAAGDDNARKLLEGRAENPLAELLAGGLQSNLRHAPYVAASLDVRREGLKLAFKTPHRSEWVDEARQHYFRPADATATPSVALGDDTVFALRAYRDIASMWLRAGDLFNERIVAKMEEADSNLSTLFAGRDFGQDILGALGPDAQLIIARQDFSQQKTKPAIRLPAFALVFHLKDPEKMRPELRRTFQSAVGFANVAGAQQGQPQLDMDMEKDEGRQIISASYIAEEDEQGSDKARINFNFSPSVAFAGDRFILASSKQLASTLAIAPESTAGGDEAATNTNARLDMKILKQLLEDNRQHLVAQNMLEEGNDAETAEVKIEALLAVVDMLRDATIRLATEDEHLQLEFNLRLEDEVREE